MEFPSFPRLKDVSSWVQGGRSSGEANNSKKVASELEWIPRLFPAIRQETGLLDSLGRLDPADRSVEISRLLWVRFLAQNASPRDADSRKMISESSSIRYSDEKS